MTVNVGAMDTPPHVDRPVHYLTGQSLIKWGPQPDDVGVRFEPGSVDPGQLVGLPVTYWFDHSAPPVGRVTDARQTGSGIEVDLSLIDKPPADIRLSFGYVVEQESVSSETRLVEKARLLEVGILPQLRWTG